MKVTVIQFDNRPPEKLGPFSILMDRNRAYAARHGYDYHFITVREPDLPVYWLKPHLVRQALETGSDIVAWIDTDAVIQDLDRRIEDFFVGEELMVAAGDNPKWPSPFNAGVFFVRSAKAIPIMDRWAALFAGTGWKRTATNWVCEDEWAGLSYEQGAFTAHLLKPLLEAGDLRLTPWAVLQSPFPMPESFTVHFAGGFKINLPAYLHTLGFERVFS